MNGRASSWVCLSTVTWRSCMHSSRPDWVLGEARLISSTSTTLANTGPGPELEAALALVEDVGAHDVGGQQVGGALHARVLGLDRARRARGPGRSCRPRGCPRSGRGPRRAAPRARRGPPRRAPSPPAPRWRAAVRRARRPRRGRVRARSPSASMVGNARAAAQGPLRLSSLLVAGELARPRPRGRARASRSRPPAPRPRPPARAPRSARGGRSPTPTPRSCPRARRPAGRRCG